MVAGNGRVVLITGANKGLGMEIGRQPGALGYTVVLGAGDEEAGNSSAEELRASGTTPARSVWTVTSPDDVAPFRCHRGPRAAVVASGDARVVNQSSMLGSLGSG